MCIAVNQKFDDRIRISYSRTEEVETPQQVEHPLVRHALDITGIDGGIEDDDGLARWKSGWTHESRPGLVCGAILRPAEYGELTRARGVANTSYFPSYRALEDR